MKRGFVVWLCVGLSAFASVPVAQATSIDCSVGAIVYCRVCHPDTGPCGCSPTNQTCSCDPERCWDTEIGFGFKSERGGFCIGANVNSSSPRDAEAFASTMPCGR
ncbi:MAG TPA: hypothetical protein VHH36_09820 [Candidatus Thermoplasmatota archaeon]|nr:hypothetical protein [Candidatus Thermoplasmatota archaeon]